MSSDRRSLCLVGHSATRTGAPIVLLTLARWLKERGWRIRIILLGDGPLVADFAEIDPELVVFEQRVLDQPTQRQQRMAGTRGLRRLSAYLVRRRASRLHREVNALKPDLVYLNTVETLRGAAAGWSVPTILHVHELDYAIRMSLPPGTRSRLRTVPTHWIAASGPVADSLIHRNGIAAQAVTVVHPFLPPIQRTEPAKRDDSGPTPTVLGCGTVEHRKGVDLFLEAAIIYFARHPESSATWMWLGAGRVSDVEQDIRDDIEKAGLGDRVILADVVTDPEPYFKQASVFVLPSREDPFPLVCLEALRAHTPVICFDRGGGMPELIGRAGGTVVPYGNCLALADAVDTLLENPDQAQRLAEAGAKIVESDFSVAALAPKIEAVLRTIIDQIP